MVGFVYVSQEEVEFDIAMLTKLLASSVQHNAEAGITGYLYYDNGYFTQYIEGGQEPIDRLIDSLKRDSRHSILNSFSDSIQSRRFCDWSMRWLQRSELVEINLENILIDYLKFTWGDTQRELDVANHVWAMVERIAQLRNRISGENHQ